MADIIGIPQSARGGITQRPPTRKASQKLELKKFCNSVANTPCIKKASSVQYTAHRSVAQLAEHWSPKPGVAGLSPAGPATFIRMQQR